MQKIKGQLRIPKLSLTVSKVQRSNLEGGESSLEDSELVFVSDGRRSNLDGGESSWEDYELVFVSDGRRSVSYTHLTLPTNREV